MQEIHLPTRYYNNKISRYDRKLAWAAVKYESNIEFFEPISMSSVDLKAQYATKIHFFTNSIKKPLYAVTIYYGKKRLGVAIITSYQRVSARIEDNTNKIQVSIEGKYLTKNQMIILANNNGMPYPVFEDYIRNNIDEFGIGAFFIVHFTDAKYIEGNLDNVSIMTKFRISY